MLVASCCCLQDACRTILYSRESCEEDMVHTSMLDCTNEMDNTKLIYKTAKLIRNNKIFSMLKAFVYLIPRQISCANAVVDNAQQFQLLV